MSFEDFRKYIEWAVSDYNTKRPHSSLNYMTTDEFESAILNEDFRKKWIEKEIGSTNMLNYSGELKKLSEGSGSRSVCAAEKLKSLKNSQGKEGNTERDTFRH